MQRNSVPASVNADHLARLARLERRDRRSAIAFWFIVALGMGLLGWVAHS